MSHPLAALLAQLRTVFTRETLPPPPALAEAPRPRKGIARLLFSLEELPLDPTPPPRSKRGLLATIFAPECLPLEPERPPRRRHPWLSWLLAPERIDRGSNPPEVH
jgi:hypothetical protein